MIDKDHIISEICRTANANGGVPLGRNRFKTETGIGESDWLGKFWRQWSEAIVEAGYVPNRFQAAYDDDHLLEKLVSLIKELGAFPVEADIRIKARTDPTFPSHGVFQRLGSKSKRAARIIDFCVAQGGLDDVVSLCVPIAQSRTNQSNDHGREAAGRVLGVVYLMKCGRFYKIGYTNAAGRREYELAIQMPERAEIIHQINTDDPRGIEEYWHKRFADRRKNGEWFDLSAADVSAFRRRKFM